MFGVGQVEAGGVVGAGQGERWVAVGAEGRVDVEADSPVPAEHAEVEVEQGAGVAAGEQDVDARDHGGDQEGYPEERQHDVVRDGKEHLHQPEPAGKVRVELADELHGRAGRE